MAKIQLFEAQKWGKAWSVQVQDEEADQLVIVRIGLTKPQAQTLANRLNNEVTESKELKPTRREQKFSAHIEVDIEFIPEGNYNSDDESQDYCTASELKTAIEDAIENETSWVDGDVTKEKAKITVKKLYDKQVPNV